MKNVEFRSFTIDKNLAFLIQHATNDSTKDILAYFYELGRFVAEESISSSRAHQIVKNVVLMYKDTAIPYRLEVHSNYGWQNADSVRIYMQISFPKQKSNYDCSELLNSIVEDGLGLTGDEIQSMPKFEKPTFKTPIFLRDLRKKYESKF